MKGRRILSVSAVTLGLLIVAVLGPSASIGADGTDWAIMQLSIGSQDGYMYEGETDAVVTFDVDALWTVDLFENDWHLVVVWDGIVPPPGITVPDAVAVWPSDIFEWTTTTLIMRGDSAGSIVAGSYGFSVFAVDTSLPPAPPVPPARGTLVIEPPDNPPVADDKTVAMSEGEWVGFALTGSDPDPSDTLTFSIVSWPTHGSLTTTTLPDVLYGPDPGFTGTDSFSFKVIDNHGMQSGEATVLITVNPVNDPPVADAGPDRTVEANAVLSATGIVLDGTRSSDPDGDELSYDWTWSGGSASGPTPTVTLGMGATVITLTVSDGRLSASDTVNVWVIDTTPPFLALPPDVTREANTTGGFIGSIGGARADDVCDPAPVVSNDAPDLYPVGTTVVTWTVTDASGNTSSARQVVTVVDTTPPIIFAPSDLEVTANTAGGYSGDIGTATATDICDSDVQIENDAPDVFPLGQTVVTWTATDDAGNTASATQVVTVGAVPISIDIRPGSALNTVNLRARGVLPVAVCSTAGLDATTVLVSSVRFAGAQPVRWTYEDIDGDGDLDLLMQFHIPDLTLTPASVEAVLTGTTLDSIPIEGSDVITIVP